MYVTIKAAVVHVILAQLVRQTHPSQVPLPIKESDEYMYKCISAVAARSFRENGLTLVIPRGEEPKTLFTDLSLIISQSFLIIHWAYHAAASSIPVLRRVQNILVIVALDKIEETFNRIVAHTTWNGNATYLVVLKGSAAELSTMWELMEKLWRRSIMNVNVLLPVHSEVSILTWLPYKQNGSSFIANIKNVDVCRIRAGVAVFETGSDLRKPHVSTNFYGRKVTVGLTAQPPFIIKLPGQPAIFYEGLEFRLMNCLAEALNFSWTWKAGSANFVPTKGGGWKSGSIISHLSNDIVDLAIAGIPLKNELIDEFEPSILYSSDTYRWYVPNARRVPSWQLIFSSIPSVFYTCSAIACGMIVGTVYRLMDVEFAKALLASWSVLVEMNFFIPSVTTRSRVFVIVILLYAMHTSIVFKFAFYFNLHHDVYQPEVRTLEDLEMSNIFIDVLSGSDVYESVVSEARNRGLNRLLQRLGNCNRTAHARNHCYARLKENEDNYGVVSSEKQTDFMIPLFYVDNTGTPFMHKLDEVIKTHYIAMYFLKGDPLAHAINRLLVGVVQGGLMKPWKLLVDQAMKDYPGIKKKTEHSKKDTASLSTSHLSGAFAALGLGLVLSSGVFVGELFSWSKPTAVS